MLEHLETISGKSLAEGLDGVANRAARDERIVVEHRGQRFALVSIEDLQWLEEADAEIDEQMLTQLEATKDSPDRQVKIPFHADMPGPDALKSNRAH